MPIRTTLDRMFSKRCIQAPLPPSGSLLLPLRSYYWVQEISPVCGILPSTVRALCILDGFHIFRNVCQFTGLLWRFISEVIRTAIWPEVLLYQKWAWEKWINGSLITSIFRYLLYSGLQVYSDQHLSGSCPVCPLTGASCLTLSGSL